MGLRQDLDRFNEVGEERRQDLIEFIKNGELGTENTIKIPIKIVDLPEFAYDQRDMGGVGQGQGGTPEPGDQVGEAEEDGDGDDGDEDGDPGEEEGDHGYYEMDPEEFAEALDRELELDLEPKGKEIEEVADGDFTDIARQGPSTMLDLDHLFKRGLQRKLAVEFDEDYVREGLRVSGVMPDDVYEWARKQQIPVSYDWIEREAQQISWDKWDSFEELEANVERKSVPQIIREEGLKDVPFRPEDERYRHQETSKKKQTNAVIINIRDVSGSMGESKRELIERVFTPMDWYLQGKYENAEFHYIAHDYEAWEVDREDFFGIQSGGGTRISSAYEKAQTILEDYPWSEWNRFIFAGGDGENHSNDTKGEVIPMMAEINANQQGYVEVKSSGSVRGTHGEMVYEHFGSGHPDVTVSQVDQPDHVTEAIQRILGDDNPEKH